jgi:hypothetical protein
MGEAVASAGGSKESDGEKVASEAVTREAVTREAFARDAFVIEEPPTSENRVVSPNSTELEPVVSSEVSTRTKVECTLEEAAMAN